MMFSKLQTALKKKKTGAIRIENGIKVGSPIFAWLLILPAFITWLVFWLYVNFDSIILSFQKSNGDWTLQHYQWVIQNLVGTNGEDGMLGIALKNTLTYFFVNYFIVQTFNVVLAYFLYKKIKGYKFFRFFLYLPNLLAGATLATIYKQLIAYNGPIIDMLYNWGWITERYQLLYSDRYAMTLSVVYSLWVCVGANMIYSLGAMARVPQEVLEAAQLDGVTPWQEFVHLILPLISGTLSTLYVLGLAGFLNAGGATLFLTNGNYNTQTLSFWIFWQIYTGGSTGTSSALGIMMTLVMLPVTYFVKWVAAKISPEVTY
ncbi:MAG: sugar ABC transporter permease [Clostridia bacterium]|nr:sugar ABC transporter permease [Clostridia bacterium]